ncbi:hypothetical protein SAMN05192574_10594 [Mucilaginibacter gossypiicola]|uniref:Uncharacterized protein n=1 Tax=Mucilaginibacter gossypiicola TaxID=551995 RepID=A0A1H8LHC2_9SPHI|nr:hypothetical protein SAMN05192574_10594 [Mucilaginibacter gossypiicola]
MYTRALLFQREKVKPIPSFKNVDVFNFVNQILGLKYNGKVNGTDQLADEILKKIKTSYEKRIQAPDHHIIATGFTCPKPSRCKTAGNPNGAKHD